MQDPKRNEGGSKIFKFDPGIPQRKTKAGPALLTTYTAPGATQRSLNTTQVVPTEKKKESVMSTGSGNSVNNDVLMATKKKALNENVTIDGKINVLCQVENEKDTFCCQYSEDYSLIATGYADGIIRLYRSGDGQFSMQLSDKEIEKASAPVTAIKHKPVSKNYPITNCFTSTYANGCVKCWSYAFNQCIYTIREKRQTFGITYHPRLPKFVTYGDDCKLYLYDEESRTQERILQSSDNATLHNGHTSRVFAACFHPRSNHELITGGWDDVVQFWDLRQPHAIRHISGVHMCGEGIDINLKGTEILTCSWQKKDPLQLWDYSSGKLVASMEPDIHNSKLYCGRYATKDFIIAAGSDPNLLRVVDLQTQVTNAFMMNFNGAVVSMDLGPAKKPKKKEVEGGRTKSDFSINPRIAFVSGKKLYEIDFY